MLPWSCIAVLPRVFSRGTGGILTLLAPGKATVLAVAAVLALLLVACGGGPGPSPTPDPGGDQPAELAPLPGERSEPASSVPATTAALSPIPDAGTTAIPDTGTTSPSRPTPPAGTALPPPTAPGAGPGPTPNPANSSWVRQRLDAVITLYDVTDAGAALVQSLDIRQMRGEPGFFGSYGFKEWAGVGEAKPTSVMHELGHSYWGGFPVEGFPELGWDVPPGESLSPALERYHSEILIFMAQPPDGFELLRQRLRNLPELSSDNLEPLFHNVEASLVYNTGGNQALVPPILRKYWSRFLNEGPFGSWHDAVSWYRSLPDEDRAAANRYLGFEHLDLRQYGSPVSSDAGVDLLAARRGILEREEKQRLLDLADQFDLLLGDPQKEENFQFWRGYLRDKADLHRRHEGYLASLDLPRAAELASALDFLTEVSGLSPDDQARRLAEQLPAQPFLVNFLPALDTRTLLELFDAGTPLPKGSTLQATASFVERLNRFGVVVDGVLAAGRDDPRQGAAELLEFLSGTGFEQKEDLRLFFELLRDEDPAAAGQVVGALDKGTIRRLMEPVPAHLRFALTPDQLLAKLDVTAEAEVSTLQRGVALLVEEPSGNFLIDEPFLHRMFDVVAARRLDQTQDMVRLLQETPFPLEGFIQQQPRAAVALLGSDLEAAVTLLRDSDPVLSPPSRIVYRLIYADPVMAARLVQALYEMGEMEMTVESLSYFAYDRARSEAAPELPISLEQDGRFLEALLGHQGADGLARRLSEAFALFGGRAASGQVSADFLSEYRATLDAASATVVDAVARDELRRIVSQVAEERAVGR